MREFYVRIPDENTKLLEQLARESSETGIKEARLIVQYATKFVEMMKGQLVPLISSGSNGVNGNGYANGFREPEQGISESALDGSAMDALFGDPDE